jgi:hypothetical protein
MVPVHTLVTGLDVKGLGVKGLGVKGPGGEPPPARRPWRRGGPGKTRPAPAPEPKIDLDRLVWDPEYRDEIRRRLNRHA